MRKVIWGGGGGGVLGATRGELDNLKNKAFRGKDDSVSLQRQVRL